MTTMKDQETRMNDTNDSGSGSQWRRRTVLGALGAAPVAAGAALAGIAPGTGTGSVVTASEESGSDRIPRDARPGGAYDRYVAELAEQGRFSGVVLLAHRGRTVLSRSYGMADKERGIPNHEDTAFHLSSAGIPILDVAVLQLVQQRQVTLADTVGTHLTGIAPDIAEKVTIHHLIGGPSGIDGPVPDPHRIFYSREEVHEYYQELVRQATLVGVPGAIDDVPLPGGGVAGDMAAQLVEAKSGMWFWDYVHEHVFGRAGMTGSAYYTRDQWLEDEHIAHPYMLLPDGSEVDGVRNLDKDSMSLQGPGENPGRAFVGKAFATAPDLLRFAEGLYDGTVLDRPFADLFAGAKMPHWRAKDGGPPPAYPSFDAYSMPVAIINGQWVIGRGGASGGVGANWNIYPDTGWVGVVLCNDDHTPLYEIVLKEVEVITGAPVDPGGGG
jgi:CubicO group peptidase (beta-lactamase class C family)